MIDYSKVEKTDWLIKGISEKQLQKEKRQALRRIAFLKSKKKFIKWVKEHLSL